jgi:hypothetical protein
MEMLIVGAELECAAFVVEGPLATSAAAATDNPARKLKEGLFMITIRSAWVSCFGKSFLQ